MHKESLLFDFGIVASILILHNSYMSYGRFIRVMVHVYIDRMREYLKQLVTQ